MTTHKVSFTNGNVYHLKLCIIFEFQDAGITYDQELYVKKSFFILQDKQAVQFSVHSGETLSPRRKELMQLCFISAA